MTKEEIAEVVASFAGGAKRAQKAGFDGVQLHAAHGWLLSSFLSPFTNQRHDEYGGNTENRCRIIEEIYDQIKSQTGPEFPVLIKLNVTDFLVGGLDMAEVELIATRLARKGFAAIETSGGMWQCVTRSEEELGWKPVMIPESRTNIKAGENEAYFRESARALKSKIGIPVILVGGLRSLPTIESIISGGDADFIALSRPLIKEPDLPNKWLTGKVTDAGCISCNACLRSLREGGLRCLQPS